VARAPAHLTVASGPVADKSDGMPILEPRHDYAHGVEPDTAWSESYYFNAYDPVTDSGLFTRIGVRPNEGTMDVGLSVWLPGGDLAEYRHVVPSHEAQEAPLAVGGVRYELVEPMVRWRLVADIEATARRCSPTDDGRRPVALTLDATFSALTPGVGSDGGGGGSRQAGAAAVTTGKGHLEQAGRWSGSLSVDGHTVEWADARGNRDRSWGPRRWGGPPMWRWFSGNIGDDLHFGGIRLGTDAGDLHRGWVSRGGRVTSVREWGLSTEVAEDGLTQRVIHLEVTDKSGRTEVLTGRVLRVADIGRPGGTVINEGLCEWTHHRGDGTTAIGYGIGEYLHQVDELGRPRVPVG
jgi:hypothetical protein